MSKSEKVNNKFKSLSLQRDRNYVRTLDQNSFSYTDDGYITQNNESNRSIARKSSIKNKLFSLFKSRPKRHQSEVSAADSNARTSITRESSIKADSSRSTISTNNLIKITPNSSLNQGSPLSEDQYKRSERYDILDRQLMNQLSLHSLTESIVDCVTEQSCSSIKLPSSWITTIGTHISNKALQPFLTSIPGLMGIKNHGNTCYVNVIIQCLAHIDSIAQYFSTKDYICDLKQIQEKRLSKPATEASSLDVLVALSYLLQSLWQFTYSSKVSMKFCQLLTLHKTQFSIDSQQDAHELLLCILNLLHDNLTRPVTDPDEETSFIYDNFRGWLSSDIKCPQCGYRRSFNDQILSLNLPIPKAVYNNDQAENEFIFNILVLNGSQSKEKHAFEATKATTVGDIRSGIAKRLNCESNDVVVLELVDTGFGQMYSDTQLIADIRQKNNYFHSNGHDNCENGLYAVFIPNQVVDVDALSLDTWSDNEIYSTMKRRMDLWDSQPFIRLLVVHVEKHKEFSTELSETLRRNLNLGVDSESSTTINSRLSFNQKHFLRFTNVLTVQAARKTKLSLLRHSLSEQMCKYLNLKNVTKLPKPQFLIEGSHFVPELDMYPLSHISVTMALKESADIYGEESAVVRLVVVWPSRTTQLLRSTRRVGRDSVRTSQFWPLNSQKLTIHSSVEELTSKYNSKREAALLDKEKDKTLITINDCLRAFFSLDSVSVTEPWNCPSCQTTQQAHTNIRIKQAPEILILMLKRFTNGHSPSGESLLSQGTPDIKDLGRKHSSRNGHNVNSRKDSLPKKNNGNKADEYLNKLDCFIDYPVEGLNVEPYMENPSEDDLYLYDLVGVVNHRGNLSNGHYVAMCQNSVDNQWRVYDDDRVAEISKLDVVHPDAYILFYKRRSNSLDLPSDLNLHWSYRRLSFPDKMHRNQTPNPTSPYSKHRRYSDQELPSTRPSYCTLPLSLSSQQNCNNSISSRLSSIHEKPVLDRSILSPHLSSSSCSSSMARCDSVSTPALFNNDDDHDRLLDIRTIASRIVDLDCCSSNGSSTHDDSGAVLSRVGSSCTVQSPTKARRNSGGYNSLSSSPSPSSPSASANKLSLCQSP